MFNGNNICSSRCLLIKQTYLNRKLLLLLLFLPLLHFHFSNIEIIAKMCSILNLHHKGYRFKNHNNNKCKTEIIRITTWCKINRFHKNKNNKIRFTQNREQKMKEFLPCKDNSLTFINLLQNNNNKIKIL